MTSGSDALDPLLINESVRVERDSALGWIVLTRPGQINAINDDIRLGVPKALGLLESDPQVRVILIRGEGERGFCAGADIKEKRGEESAIQVRQRMERSRWIESLDGICKPVIAAIHGYCMGGGLELALACDIRFAAPNAVFALPETGLGLIPGGGGTQRLARVVAPGLAMDLLLTGERVRADEARRIGLVTRLASDESNWLDEVAALARLIAAKPPAASAYVKQAARAALELDIKRGLDLELDLFALLAPTKDRREAALAFAERREPRFTGE
ncbi:TPA: enoyl-CoA hydratase/isomerase family protein [Pseudomonas aeruginosa]|uniref:enoyl-CoA hydratase/isomerase family protein n=1 Tax=Pseudomonas aeruginosa group TaxID=136841 RepID=UPI0005BCCB58|nr:MULTISPECIES: enoyl-CoA hydratase/isomerase family protein [Pseudomonas aeruginosa group]MCO2157295.1 enoyl-CoA hydratase/isomerase family protein [Pseudomonas aeruginosa]MDF3934085.1 enoyl-CoA hydratase/isomerase family protein [Pseudomonas citronellolis]MDI9795377.1 enoyl-CoA hydratase/isomerase family protein [Pseudomonas aeruginosa]NPX94184.1 enoyl-CoA hydratase/isomerase family protein [Pseudomonas aeruginosa]HBO4122981.1 enoyl-CoA hydratase/isomerase family protein [Pseudomonas aerugi